MFFTQMCFANFAMLFYLLMNVMNKVGRLYEGPKQEKETCYDMSRLPNHYAKIDINLLYLEASIAALTNLTKSGCGLATVLFSSG